MDCLRILQRNIEAAYPVPTIDPTWVDPGKSRGWNEAYRYPSGDFLRDGFAPVGMEMTDFTVIEADGLFHIYTTLQAPGTAALWEGQHNYILHITTTDFSHYTVHRPVLVNDLEHPWEESHVWPPFVIWNASAREYAMIYVGMDKDGCQSLGLAVSKDLYAWRRFAGNPVFNGQATEWIHKWKDGRVRHLRDPHIMKLNGEYLMYYTTLCDDLFSGVGLAVSDDLKVWRDLGPCFKRDATAPWLLESPLVIGFEDRYYLIPSQSPGIQCFVSEDPTYFHGAREVELTCVGVEREQITAPEIIRCNSDSKPWVIGFYLADSPRLGLHPGKRLYLGLMTLSDQGIRIERVTKAEQLEGLLVAERS